MSVGKTIIVPVSNEERAGNPDKDYFAVKIEEEATLLEEDGTYSAVPYRTNDWIVFVRWYTFVPSKINGSGDRFYTRGFDQWIPCGSIIRSLTLPMTLQWTRKYYRLRSTLNIHIRQHGDIYYLNIFK